MELKYRQLYNLESQSLLPIKNQVKQAYQSPLPSSDSLSPFLAIAVLSLMASAFLLVTYFIFVNKCYSNWNQLNLLRRLTFSRTQQNDDLFIAISPPTWNQGLEESMIREIPMFQFERGENEERSIYGCVVCLNEFQEHDMLRVLPSCSHSFHLDCIDVWLQSNGNCPLCRKSVSGKTRNPIDQIVAPSSSPQNSSSLMDSDDDYVVIELGGENEVVIPQERQEERNNDCSTRKLEKKVANLNSRKCHHVSIMGDEGIDVREKDDQFSIQPIRRSFSMDSAADQQLYLTVETIIRQNRHNNETSSSQDTGSRRSFFPFRHGRGSRNAILPLESDL